MKITCSKGDLLAAINIALRAVPSKSTLPILESFFIEAGEEISLTTNDNDMGIKTFVDGTVNEPGKIAIEARLFSEIVRKLPENEVLIETDSRFKVHVLCEDSEFYINGSNGDEFPDLPNTEFDQKATVSEFTLKELIRQTIFSIAQNDANALMRGELFEIKGNTLRVISLDSHRISIRKEELANSYNDAKVIVPGKTLLEISRILSGDQGKMVELIFDNRFIKFNLEKTMIVSRLIEGEYFNVDQMISNDQDCAVKINRNDFTNTIDRAITLTREGDKKPIVLDIRDSEMSVDINSALGSMSAKLPVTKTGKDLVIGFNPKFFIDALKVIDDEEVTVYFVNSNAPCFIRSDDGSYNYIILPVNINR